jgi:hypothetical protein
MCFAPQIFIGEIPAGTIDAFEMSFGQAVSVYPLMRTGSPRLGEASELQ